MWDRDHSTDEKQVIETRRALRFMRLEKRFMLSGDFGESFETDDDFHFEDETPFEIDSHDDHGEYGDRDESHDHDDDDSSEFEAYDDDAHDDDEVIRFVSFEVNDQSVDQRFDDLEQDDDGATIEADVESDQVSDVSSTIESLDATESSEIEGELVAEDSDSQNAQSASAVSRSSRSEPDEIGSRSADILHVPNELRSSADSRRFERIPLVDTETNQTNRSSDTAEPNGGTEDSSDVSATLPGGQKTESTDARPHTHLPTTDQPSKNEELNSSAIVWLGSFADDLSAVDEALGLFLSDARETAAASIDALTEPTPLVTAGLATAAVAAHTVYRRKRAKDSQLENDFYAVGFDVRLYPELFG